MSEPGDFEPDRAGDRTLGLGDPVVQVVEIVNKKGLHARASAKFVKLAEEFDAQVRVTRSGETVGGTSIMGLMMLAASTGTRITIEATGSEAPAAVSALSRLVRDRFGEED
jgi:phosphocarrier protein HPr